MAWPADLNPEEQEIVKVFVDQIYRAGILRLVQALNRTEGAREEWDNRVHALIARLDTDDVVPNGSGLAAAEELTKTEILEGLGVLAVLLEDFNNPAQRAAYVEVIGSLNMVKE